MSIPIPMSMAYVQTSTEAPEKMQQSNIEEEEQEMMKIPWGNRNRTQPLSMYAEGQQISQKKTDPKEKRVSECKRHREKEQLSGRKWKKKETIP
jgi:hypothetical protein